MAKVMPARHRHLTSRVPKRRAARAVPRRSGVAAAVIFNGCEAAALRLTARPWPSPRVHSPPQPGGHGHCQPASAT